MPLTHRRNSVGNGNRTTETTSVYIWFTKCTRVSNQPTACVHLSTFPNRLPPKSSSSADARPTLTTQLLWLLETNQMLPLAPMLPTRQFLHLITYLKAIFQLWICHYRACSIWDWTALSSVQCQAPSLFKWKKMDCTSLLNHNVKCSLNKSLINFHSLVRIEADDEQKFYWIQELVYQCCQVLTNSQGHPFIFFIFARLNPFQ